MMGYVKDRLRILRRLARISLGRDFYCRIQERCLTERHGSKYAGWTICPINISKDSVVYSIGVGEDVSFDLSLIEKYGVDIYAFDPTPKSMEWVKSQNLPVKFNFNEYGVANYDGYIKFYPPENPNHVSHTIFEKKATLDRAIMVPVRRLRFIMNEHGHDRIDILKMDIEGSEYAVIEDMIKSDIDVSQLLVEFHHRFENVGIEKTKDAIQLLNNHGFKIFAISPNGEEFSFIRM